jgi:hypothetical protein
LNVRKLSINSVTALTQLSTIEDTFTPDVLNQLIEENVPPIKTSELPQNLIEKFSLSVADTWMKIASITVQHPKKIKELLLFIDKQRESSSSSLINVDPSSINKQIVTIYQAKNEEGIIKSCVEIYNELFQFFQNEDNTSPIIKRLDRLKRLKIITGQENLNTTEIKQILGWNERPRTNDVFDLFFDIILKNLKEDVMQNIRDEPAYKYRDRFNWIILASLHCGINTGNFEDIYGFMYNIYETLIGYVTDETHVEILAIRDKKHSIFSKEEVVNRLYLPLSEFWIPYLDIAGIKYNHNGQAIIPNNIEGSKQLYKYYVIDNNIHN